MSIGVRPLEWVDLPPPRAEYYNVSVACLDGVDIHELISAPLGYVDGLNNDRDATPKDVRHL